MTSQQEFDLVTRTGPGTPMGELMRQYWIPAALSSELKADGPPVRIMLLGEKMIAFRDTSGRVGIMDHRCPHRCASLFYGRNEEGGIRCVYHGWKYDVDGNCLDQAQHPPSTSISRTRSTPRPISRASATTWCGSIWATAAARRTCRRSRRASRRKERVGIRFVQRGCNWLQAVEGDLDTSHVGRAAFRRRASRRRSSTTATRTSSSTARPNTRSTETPLRPRPTAPIGRRPRCRRHLLARRAFPLPVLDHAAGREPRAQRHGARLHPDG